MLNILSPDSFLGRWLTFLVDAVLISLVWLLCSVPIVTIGAANAALFRVAMNWMRHREGCTVKEFLRAFRSNFRKATILWLVLLAFLVLIALDGYLVLFTELELPGIFRIMFFVLLALWVSWAGYTFALQSVFENSIGRTLGNALRFIPGTFTRTVILLLIDCVAAFLAYLVPLAAWVIIPAVVFLSARIYWNGFLPLVSKDSLTTNE